MSRYNLRERSAKAAAKQGAQILPGEFLSSPAKQTNSASSRSSIGTRSDAQNTDSEDEKRRTYSQVASSRAPSLEPRVPEESPAAVSAREAVSDDGLINTNISCLKDIPETSGRLPSYLQPKIETVEEGQWRTAGKRGKHSRSSSWESERGYASEASLGEGTSDLKATRKGKGVNLAGTALAGFEDYELDPERQRRELEHYTKSQAVPMSTEARSVSWAHPHDSTSGSLRSGVSSVTERPKDAGTETEEVRARDILYQIELLEQELVQLQLHSPTPGAADGDKKQALPSTPADFHLPKRSGLSASRLGKSSERVKRSKYLGDAIPSVPLSSVSTRPSHAASDSAADVNQIPASVLVTTTVDRARGIAPAETRNSGRKTLDPVLRPETQVTAGSYLGQSFRRLGVPVRRKSGQDSPSSSSSSSGTENSEPAD
ncbi:hypothetical protein C2E23DRAFT_879958 [Lenzites betulinus]|nr:hypothetical protein C2E23DRAFT_879958 [Lenzites betulinus]